MIQVIIRISFWPAIFRIYSLILYEIPVLTRLSPITKSSAIKIILGSLNPDRASAGVNTPVMVIAVIVSSAIMSILNLLSENKIMAINSNIQTMMRG